MSKDLIPGLPPVHHHPDYRGFRPLARDYLRTYWSSVTLKEVGMSLGLSGPRGGGLNYNDMTNWRPVSRRWVPEDPRVVPLDRDTLTEGSGRSRLATPSEGFGRKSTGIASQIPAFIPCPLPISFLIHLKVFGTV